MEPWVRVCRSWEEEAAADREFWLRFSAEERVAQIDTMRDQWAAMTNASRPSHAHRSLLAVLAHQRVRALLVGAHAIAFHAKPHYTAQLDVFIDATDAHQVHQVVKAAGIRVPGEEPDRINIITALPGITFADAWAGRIATSFAGTRVHVIGKAALLRNKEASGRTQDLADAELLRRFL